jgi:hypothetical protein
VLLKNSRRIALAVRRFHPSNASQAEPDLVEAPGMMLPQGIGAVADLQRWSPVRCFRRDGRIAKMSPGAVGVVGTPFLSDQEGCSPELLEMKARTLVLAAVRVLAAFGLAMTLLLPLMSEHSVPAARASSTLKSVSCDWPASDPYTLSLTVSLTEPATSDYQLTLRTDHPELLWPDLLYGGWGGVNYVTIHLGSGQLVLRLDHMVRPTVDTPVTITTDLYGVTVSCSTVIPSAPPPADALLSLVCAWDNAHEGINVTATLTTTAETKRYVSLTADHPELIHNWDQPGNTRQLIIYPGYLSDRYGAWMIPYPEKPATLKFTAEYGGATMSCQAAIPGEPRTPTPVVTPNLTPSPTPVPTRTPTPPPPPKLSSMRIQTGSRSGNPSGMRICLDRDAPDTHTAVTLVSDHPAIFPVPPAIGIPRGARCISFNVLVRETRTAVPVTVAARFGSRTLTGATMVRPSRPSVYTQTASRSLGLSKVTVCATTSAGGDVPLTSSRPDIFPVPSVVAIPAGKACASIVVPVGYVSSDTPVMVTATFDSGVKTSTTIVKNFGALPPPMATPTSVPTETLVPTETDTPVPTTADTPVPTPSATDTPATTVP